MATLVEEILLLLRPELGRRRITWSWERREEVPEVALDRNQVEQVLVNVLRNALEAIGEDGRITLSLGLETAAGGPAGATRPPGHPLLTIRDSGPGIPEDVRNRLFTPFFSTKRNGRGLGLTLAHEIVTQHGFELRLENHLRGGAEFTIRF